MGFQNALSTLSSPDLGAKVGLWGGAEDAVGVFALRCVAGDHDISHLGENMILCLTKIRKQAPGYFGENI